jgi:hypothetical protein
MKESTKASLGTLPQKGKKTHFTDKNDPEYQKVLERQTQAMLKGIRESKTGDTR